MHATAKGSTKEHILDKSDIKDKLRLHNHHKGPSCPKYIQVQPHNQRRGSISLHQGQVQ